MQTLLHEYDDNRYARWHDLWHNVERCNVCPALVFARKLVEYSCPTFGIGSMHPTVMLIGEAPGRHGCGRTGIPFTLDRSGKFMLDALAEVPMDLDYIYITNAVKCNPPMNRTPTENEINNCKQWLMREIELLNPPIICALGAVAYSALTCIYPTLKKSYRDARTDVQIINERAFFAVYHPSYVMRQSQDKRKKWLLALREVREYAVRRGMSVYNSKCSDKDRRKVYEILHRSRRTPCSH